MRKTSWASIGTFLLVTLGVIVATAQAAAVNRGSSRKADSIAQPTPATYQFALSGVAAAFYTPTKYAGDVLHWSEVEYYYDATSSDPANGRLVNSEVWARVGTDGILEAFHDRYTFADGTLDQEIFLTRSSSLIILGKDRKPNPYVDAHWCLSRNQSNFQSIAHKGPIFVNEEILSHQAERGTLHSPSIAPPATPLISGVLPFAHDRVSSQVRSWFVSASGLELEVDSSGRLVRDHTLVKDSAGKIQEEIWKVRGSIDLYRDSSVNSSMYMPNSGSEVCGQ